MTQEETLEQKYLDVVKKYDLRLPAHRMSEKNKKLVMRLNCHFEKHPEDSVKDAMLTVEGVNLRLVTKWMQRHYVVKNAGATRQSARLMNNGTMPIKKIKSAHLGKLEDERKKEAALEQQNIDLGIIKQVEVVGNGGEKSIQEIRKEIKAHLWAKLQDPQAVSQYASALAKLSGVQDDELKDDYAEKQSMQIYCPEERSEAESLEVEPIDHDF